MRGECRPRERRGGGREGTRGRRRHRQVGALVITEYTVSGMTCEHCVRAVTDEVTELPGVTGVDVELETGRLLVTSDAELDVDAVREAVDEAGGYRLA
nr:heavy metal-associated domain-containing protein [Naumannella cuiyingiana]